MINYKILIDNVDYTDDCGLPFKEQYVLDSALDNGVLTLPAIKRKEIFKPFTLVTIIKDSEEPYNMYVASDKVTEIVGAGFYTHELVLIEETKLLEKKVVDTNTTTQPIVHNYFEGQSKILPEIISNNANVTPVTPDTYINPIKAGTTFTFVSPSEIYPYSALLYAISVEKDGTVIYNGSSGSDTYSEILTENSTYVITYGYTSLLGLSSTCKYTMTAIEEQEKSTSKSITDVVNRLLAITETLRARDTSPALVFNQEQADFYNQAKETWLLNDSVDTLTEIDVDIEFISNNTTYTNIATRLANLYYDNNSVYFEGGDIWANNAYKTIIFQERPTGDLLTWLQANGTKQSEELLYPAPEFSMTKSTLRECLDQVGSYIHSIVRLKGNTIYFDKLGGTTQAVLDEDYIGNYETLDGEQYASQLDSIVSNITNIDDENQGTMIEPFRNAYKTVRAESGTLRIGDGGNETTAIIETDYPIEKIHKLICGYIKIGGNEIYVGDITPYVYESAEYGILQSNGGTYPYSKGYALCYTQGQPNITGLTFKLPNAVSPIFSKQAILNIISQKIGQPVQTAFNVQDITELNFQLIYYPSTTARVKQSRTDINNYPMELTSIYNQNANKVDSRAYGENLKGTIARLGNIEKFITFILKAPNQLPNVGDYVIIDNEDYYIATLSVENQVDNIKVTVGLSKDFNALSKYIGIKNNIRMYEISEKQSVERYVTYEDYCVIGDSITSDNKQLITSNAIRLGIYQFIGLTGGDYPVSVARVESYDKTGTAIPNTEFDLPVYSLAEGNSIWLGFRYKDNYSAGNQSVTGISNDPSSSNQYYRLNNPARYTDIWGEVESIKLRVFDYLDAVDSFDEAVQVGNTLPVSSLNVVKDPILSSASNNLIIKKDSREQINFSYQLHFVTNDNIIIGSQLAQGNRIVTDIVTNTSSASLYVLPNRINKFANKIDLTNAHLIKDYDQDNQSISWNSTQLIFQNETATNNGKSWVLVDNASGNLLFGKNIEIETGDTIEMPTMTFTHKYN